MFTDLLTLSITKTESDANREKGRWGGERGGGVLGGAEIIQKSNMNLLLSQQSFLHRKVCPPTPPVLQHRSHLPWKRWRHWWGFQSTSMPCPAIAWCLCRLQATDLKQTGEKIRLKDLLYSQYIISTKTLKNSLHVFIYMSMWAWMNWVQGWHTNIHSLCNAYTQKCWGGGGGGS